MSEEEQKIADAAVAAKAIEDAKASATIEVDTLAQKDAEIAKLTGERDNYKAVALKRLGKLEGDADFLAGDDEDKKELSVAEQVKIALMDREIESAMKAKDDETKRIVRENTELRLALKNRPQESIGGEGGASEGVKDNVFTAAQITELKARAIRLKLDPEKFVENAKKNIQSR